MMNKTLTSMAAALLLGLSLLLGSSWGGDGRIENSGNAPNGTLSEHDRAVGVYAQQMIVEGRRIFRFDTFGSEAFWGEGLKLHRAIAGEKNGGIGGGVSPKTALAVGLKVDADALPEELKQQLKAGKVNLDDPATTLALLKLNAVVGITGSFDGNGNIGRWAFSVPCVTRGGNRPCRD